jgi:hypothetical protein
MGASFPGYEWTAQLGDHGAKGPNPRLAIQWVSRLYYHLGRDFVRTQLIPSETLAVSDPLETPPVSAADAKTAEEKNKQYQATSTLTKQGCLQDRRLCQGQRIHDLQEWAPMAKAAKKAFDEGRIARP